MTDAPTPQYSSGTNSLRQLAERLDQSAVKYANDYGYCIASDLKQAAEIVRGVAQASQEPVAYVPLSKAVADRGEPIWREVFAAKWLEKDVWRGFDLMPLYASAVSSTDHEGGK